MWLLTKLPTKLSTSCQQGFHKLSTKLLIKLSTVVYQVVNQVVTIDINYNFVYTLSIAPCRISSDFQLKLIEFRFQIMKFVGNLFKF